MINDLISRSAEIWKEINGFEGYKVSNLGRIINSKGKQIKPFKKGNYGHGMVSLSKNGKSKKFQVHRLVAQAFIKNPYNKPEVCHKNNELDENGFLDNSAENLIWGSHKENCAFENTRKRQSENHADFKGENNPNYGKHLSDLSKDKMMKERGKQVLQWKDGRIVAFYDSLKQAGRKTGMSWQNIKNVCEGKYKYAGGYEWTYAQKPYDVDKVVEQLEKESQNIELIYPTDQGYDYEDAIGIDINKTKQIVKSGGIE